ncbi:MAG: M28 family peptidase [Caldilineaceae bacterium]|nr:M28 family peptidase [Caldilineaceae bacterium]
MNRLRTYSLELILTGTLLASVLFFGYLGYGLLRPDVIDEPFSGVKALANAERLVSFGPRITGTEASTKAADWLVEQLRFVGWDVVIQPFAVNDAVQGRNIIAIRSSSRPGAPVALLSTHYDTRLAADADPSEAQRSNPTPGANSGASGPGLLLELARTLDVEATGYTVCLAFFDAESNGQLPGWRPQAGSQLFVESLPDSVPRCASPRFVVNVDVVGAEGQRFYQDRNGDQGLNVALWRAADVLGVESFFLSERRLMPPSSGDALRVQGVPGTNLIGLNYPFTNTTADTVDKLSAATLERIGLLLETWLESSPRL